MFGKENIAVKQARRRNRQLVRDPTEGPQIEERIAGVADGIRQVQHLRIGHQSRQRDKEKGCAD